MNYIGVIERESDELRKLEERMKKGGETCQVEIEQVQMDMDL